MNASGPTEIVKKHGKASILTAANMFAHVASLKDLMKGAEVLLDEGSYFITESHYLLDIQNRLQFDSIYHEHLKSYSLKDLVFLFDCYDFTLVDAERIPNYGGSIRGYAQKGKKGSQTKRLKELLLKEQEANLYDNSTWEKFKLVTWPMLGPTHVFVVTITSIRSFQVFDTVEALTRGGPSKSTYMMVYAMFE